MPNFLSDDKGCTVERLLALLSDADSGALRVRVGIGDGRGWPAFSTPVMDAYIHPGACGEGAYLCLEIHEAWGVNDG